MDNPKILLVMDKTCPGGAEIATMRFCSRLRSRFLFSVAVLGESGYLSDEFRSLGIPVFELGSQLQYKGRWNPMPLRALIKIIRDCKIDLVHSSLLRSNILGPIAARLTGKKALLHDRCYCLPTTLRQELKHQFPNKFVTHAYSHVYAYCVRHGDKVVVQTEQTKQAYKEAFGIHENSIRVLPNGIDLEAVRKICHCLDPLALKKSLSIPPESKVVSMVGRLAPPKDWFTFLKAAEEIQAQLYPSDCHVHFLIVGSGPQERRIRRYLTGKTNISYMGFKKDVFAIFRVSDVFLLTSRSESFGNVILEAMASECPVVATKTVGANSILTHGVNGFLAAIGDVRGLANHVTDLLRDDMLSQSIIRNAAKTVQEKYSLESLSHRLANIYTEALQG